MGMEDGVKTCLIRKTTDVIVWTDTRGLIAMVSTSVRHLPAAIEAFALQMVELVACVTDFLHVSVLLVIRSFLIMKNIYVNFMLGFCERLKKINIFNLVKFVVRAFYSNRERYLSVILQSFQ